MAMKYINEYPVSDELKDGVEKWQYVLECLDADPDKLDREIDWVIKRKLIQTIADKRGVGWDDPSIFMVDLQYHDVKQDRGLFYLLERKGMVERLLTDEEIDVAKTLAPPDTRAKMRGAFIKLAREHNIQYDLDWSNIRLGNLLNVRVICNNPFETDTEKVAELVRTIQKTNVRKANISKLVIQS